jgi:hypothetical protein
MEPRCTICRSERRNSIEQAIVEGIPDVRIAAQFGVSRSAVGRHRKRHLGSALWRAMARREEHSAEAMVGSLNLLRLRLEMYEGRAAEDGDNLGATRIAEVQLKVAELIGKFKHDLGDGTTTVSIDARRQLAVLAGLDTDDLRALAAAHRDGQLDRALGASVPLLSPPSDAGVSPGVTVKHTDAPQDGA